MPDKRKTAEEWYERNSAQYYDDPIGAYEQGAAEERARLLKRFNEQVSEQMFGQQAVLKALFGDGHE